MRLAACRLNFRAVETIARFPDVNLPSMLAAFANRNSAMSNKQQFLPNCTRMSLEYSNRWDLIRSKHFSARISACVGFVRYDCGEKCPIIWSVWWDIACSVNLGYIWANASNEPLDPQVMFEGIIEIRTPRHWNKRSGKLLLISPTIRPHLYSIFKKSPLHPLDGSPLRQCTKQVKFRSC